VYVADTDNHRIQKFSSSGEFLTAWGAFGSAEGQFVSPSGVAVDAAGNVYVAENGNHRVQKFTSNGAFLLAFGWGVARGSGFEVCTGDCTQGTAGDGDGQLFGPRGIAVDASGNIFVGEFARNRVQKFSSAPAFLTKWGSSGSGNGQFARPNSLAVDRSNDVYVADRDNNRIQKFDNFGTYLTQWGTAGRGPGQIQGAQDVAIDPAGNARVADFSNFRLQTFSPLGAFLSSFDTIAPAPETFRPQAVAADAAGDLYIIDAQVNDGDRVLRVREGGEPPPPVLGKAVNVGVVKGEVLVKLPAGAARASQKGTGFVPLTESRQIPVRSILDTRRGTVALRTARNRKGRTQSGRFAAGLFQVLQSRKRAAKGLTELRLKGSAARFRSCRSGKRTATADASQLSRRAIRRLRARARGRYRTRGRRSAATVRGTVWNVTDSCAGTLTRVKRGKVAVRDFRRKKTIILTRGKSYLAKARR